MSSVYVSEPPTSGKLVLETSAGNLDVELWSKEAPKACRNFTQLCMEGYYDGTIFHRVCPGWIVQGGDPSGTGEGGESIYGEPFADEFHSRLRFSRRGMLGMASTGPNTNGSQFFITLAPTPELQKKHTLFATVVGDSLFNALKLGEGEVDDETERPVFPKKLLRTRVLDNPFADIEPRKKPAPDALPAIPAASKGKKRKAKAVKNKRLLSFAGDDDDDDSDRAAVQPTKTRMKSSHDLLVSDPVLGPAVSAQAGKDRADASVADSVPHEPTMAEAEAETEAETEIEAEKEAEIEAEKETEASPTMQDTPGAASPEKRSRNLHAMFSKRSKPAGAGTKRQREGAGEDALLARLGAFQARIRGSKQVRQGQQGQGAGSSWLAHSLNFDDDANG